MDQQINADDNRSWAARCKAEIKSLIDIAPDIPDKTIKALCRVVYLKGYHDGWEQMIKRRALSKKASCELLDEMLDEVLAPELEDSEDSKA